MTHELFIDQLNRMIEYRKREMIGGGCPLSIVENAEWCFAIAQTIREKTTIIATCKSISTAWRIYKDLQNEGAPNIEVDVNMLQ